MDSKRFTSLLSEAGLRPVARTGEADVAWITADSRTVRPQSLFVCMPSKNTDTHALIAEAQSQGAVACLAHSQEGFETASAIGVAAMWTPPDQPGFNKFVGHLARAVFNDPSRVMRVTGITGTNGKTTTAWMMRDALRALGRRAAYLGTLGFDPDGNRRELSNTTPFPVETWQLLHEASLCDVQDFVMEASSHALFERRLAGISFALGVFTNLSQDHLDYHKDMADYAEAKRLLFTEYQAQRSAINVGDPVGDAWSRSMDVTLTFGAEDADLQVTAVEKGVDALSLVASYRGTDREFRIGVGGTFNVWNATSALAGLLSLGFGLEEAARAMEAVTPVPGRFESVPTGKGFSIIVDYAHTDDALSKLIASVRELGPNRVITVFGCGGDRDKTKRPKMARAASENSDITIVTSDNPRTEDPKDILKDVVAGILPGRKHEVIEDRREAIARAVKIAQDGDVIVIAGKGHENYQIIGRTKYPMDDRAMAREAL